MGKPNFSDEFKRDAVGADHGAGLPGSGGFAAPRRQPALAVCVEEAVCEGGVGRCQ